MASEIQNNHLNSKPRLNIAVILKYAHLYHRYHSGACFHFSVISEVVMRRNGSPSHYHIRFHTDLKNEPSIHHLACAANNKHFLLT